MSLPEGRPRESLVKYDPPLDLGAVSPDQVSKSKGGASSIRSQLSKKNTLPSSNPSRTPTTSSTLAFPRVSGLKMASTTFST